MKKVIIYLIMSTVGFSGFAKNLDTLTSKRALEVKSVDIQPTDENFLIAAVKSAKKAATTATKITLIAGSVSSFVG